MNIKAFLFTCCAALLVTTVDAKRPVKIVTPPASEQTQPTHQLMHQRVTELMADRVGFKKDMTDKLIEMEEMEELEAMEDLEFPADELYGEWTNDWVDPFRGKKIDMPDSCRIDCSTFVLPLDTMTYVTSKYGPRRRRMHKGIDLKVQKGDTIRAAFSGKIRIRNYERRGYGYYLVIRHPNGLETVYGHLSKFLVERDEIVKAGQPIGLGGNTGRSTGSHLHFETRYKGYAFDPQRIIDFESGELRNRVFTLDRSYLDIRSRFDSDEKANLLADSKSVNTARGASKSSPASSTSAVYHTIRKGDTLYSLALRYHTSVKRICALNNNLSSGTTLKLGRRIRIK